MTEHVTFRPGTPDDSRPCFELFLASASELATRIGSPWSPDPEEYWPRMRELYERLARHCAEWWVAEAADTGELLGYARSVERDRLFELSEFFVRPGRQSSGIGRELLARAFPEGRGEVRVIIATTDVRAQARYYATGTVARFPIAAMEGTPQPAGEPPAGLEAVRAGEADTGTLAGLEAAVLDFPRSEGELRWLLGQREGWIYRRDGRPVGFGFIGRTGSGPVAVLEPADQVPILLHLEGRAAALGRTGLSWEIPMINEVAMRHLLGRGYRMDQFLTLFMSNRPFGRFDRFIGFAPPFVL